jgi:hypothetical protein
MLGAGMLMVFAMFFIGLLLFAAFIAWRITAKTGYPGVLGLLYFVPLANLALLLVLAFSEWPIERENRLLQENTARPAPGSSPPASKIL